MHSRCTACVQAASQHVETVDRPTNRCAMTGIDLVSNRYRQPERSPFWDALGARWRSLFPARQFIHERDGVRLPPPELRAAGAIFKDDETFRTYAMNDVAMI